MAKPSAETLGKIAFEFVAQCREGLKRGQTDLSGLEPRVRDYCTAIAALAKEARIAHEPDLKRLMGEVEALASELTQARDIIRQELSALGRLRQASVAYHKSDAMGDSFRPKKKDAN